MKLQLEGTREELERVRADFENAEWETSEAYARLADLEARVRQGIVESQGEVRQDRAAGAKGRTVKLDLDLSENSSPEEGSLGLQYEQEWHNHEPPARPRPAGILPMAPPQGAPPNKHVR